jgi:hypothetical protein
MRREFAVGRSVKQSVLELVMISKLQSQFENETDSLYDGLRDVVVVLLTACVRKTVTNSECFLASLSI